MRGRSLLRLVAAGALLAAAQTAAAGDIRNGARIYQNHCAMCHGAGGRAVMPDAPSFARGERLLQPDGVLLTSIRGGKRAMPAFAGLLSDRQILDVVAYLRTMR